MSETTAPWEDPDLLYELFKAGTPDEQRQILTAVANLARTAQQLIDDVRSSHDTDH